MRELSAKEIMVISGGDLWDGFSDIRLTASGDSDITEVVVDGGHSGGGGWYGGAGIALGAGVGVMIGGGTVTGYVGGGLGSSIEIGHADNANSLRSAITSNISSLPSAPTPGTSSASLSLGNIALIPRKNRSLQAPSSAIP